MEKPEIEEKNKDRSIGKRVVKGLFILSLIAAAVLFFMTYGWAFLLMGASAWEARPTEEKIRAEVRRELGFKKYELEKEPEDYGFFETYRITVPKEELSFHAVYVIYDDIWNTGTVRTDYYDTALKKCYDTYPGERDRIVMTERESDGLQRVTLSCTYGNLQEMEECVRQVKDFGAYVDSLYPRGLHFAWEFARTVSIDCADGISRPFSRTVFLFEHSDIRHSKRSTMADFSEKLDAELRSLDERFLWKLSPDRELVYEDGQMIEWETLPGIRTIRPAGEESGCTEADFENIPAFLSALPCKSFYDLCGKLGIETEGTPADFSFSCTGSEGLHRYRFSYGFYDGEGFYYLEDDEKVYDAWLFCIDSSRVSEITGVPIRSVQNSYDGFSYRFACAQTFSMV